MAQRIIDAGFTTTLWARRPEALEPYRGSGASFAPSPSELAAASDLVCLCVVNDDDVQQVFDAMLPGVAPGAVVAVQSTVHPSTMQRLADAAAARGATVIDAPVSGGGQAAAAGTLLVMVGGDDETVARCRPVFEAYGDPVVHVGPLGAGQLAKLVNNAVFTANITLAEDALALGQAFGLDRTALADVIARGSGNSFALGVVAGLGYAGLRTLGAPLLRKDVDIVTALAGEQGATTGNLVTVADDGLTEMGFPPT